MKHRCHAFVPVLRWSLLMFAFICYARTELPALAATNGVINYKVRIWQTDDGLPQNSVHAIAQTSDGYLWVGTHDGLARFDGFRFTTLDETAAPGLKHGWITALCASSDGSLWIACDSIGVTRLKNGKFTRFTETNGLPSNQTRCLLEAKDGSIWIGGEGGLAQYKDGKFKIFTEKSGLPDVSIRGLCEDEQGVIRVATRRGLSSLNPEGNISTINFGPGAIANALRSVCQDRHGNIWVSSNEGVTCTGEQGRVFYTVNEGLPDKLATVLYEDRSGRVWAGTYSGLACLVDGKVVSKPMNETGFGDLVYAIFEDREENLWVGGRDGLYCLRPARFTTFTMQEGLTCNNVMSVCEDRSGAICLATWGGGINRLEGDRITVWNSTNGLSHDSVLALHEGRDGTLWAGMDLGGGLNRLKGDGSNTFPLTDGLINGAVRVIHEDRQGALWVGTRYGLNVLRNGKFETYTTTNGLVGNDVMAICEDGEGNLWIGTDQGLSRWDKGKFKSFTTREGLSQNAVNAIYEDPDHTLWIGTKSGGLNRFKAGKFTAYTTRQGLFSDEIYEIIEDDFGYFWMSCRKGIFRVSKQDLDDLDGGKIKMVTSASFGKVDGLVSVQCNGVAKPAGWKAADGRLWFPTIRGAVAVESRIETNDQPPPVMIEEVLADQRPLRSVGSVAIDASRLTVPPGRGELEIHFTALSFQAPEKNRFKYTLEGIDSGWINAGGGRIAHYYNLAPGSYRFRVIACNNDGVWNQTGAAVAFTFQPHAWQTWWFKLAILLVAGLLLGTFYRSRLTRLRAIENLRVQIAADLHDDVGARLTKVAMVTELVNGETPATDRNKPHIQNIARTTHEIIQAMDEIVWTINPKNDTLDHLADYIFQYAQDYFQNTGVRCRLDFPAHFPDHGVSTEERHNLFMAVKEALNNVLKHAGAKEVLISLAVVGAKLTVTIKDDGCGFSPNLARHSGNGLTNMRERLEGIGGRLILESKPGSGTTATMEANGK